MNFSWLRIGKIISIILIIAAIVAGIYFFANWRPVKIAWADLIHNRRETFLDCEELPFYPQVDKAFSQHPDIVNKVKAVPGVTGFVPEELKCKIFDGGTEFIKGDAVLTYSSRAAKTAAEKILGKDFFGLVYRGQPVR